MCELKVGARERNRRGSGWRRTRREISIETCMIDWSIGSILDDDVIINSALFRVQSPYSLSLCCCSMPLIIYNLITFSISPWFCMNTLWNCLNISAGNEQTPEPNGMEQDRKSSVSLGTTPVPDTGLKREHLSLISYCVHVEHNLHVIL